MPPRAPKGHLTDREIPTTVRTTIMEAWKPFRPSIALLASEYNTESFTARRKLQIGQIRPDKDSRLDHEVQRRAIKRSGVKCLLQSVLINGFNVDHLLLLSIFPIKNSRDHIVKGWIALSPL